MCSSLIQIGSKTAEKNSAQTNKQTNRHYENNGHHSREPKPCGASSGAALWRPLQQLRCCCMSSRSNGVALGQLVNIHNRKRPLRSVARQSEQAVGSAECYATSPNKAAVIITASRVACEESEDKSPAGVPIVVFLRDFYTSICAAKLQEQIPSSPVFEDFLWVVIMTSKILPQEAISNDPPVVVTPDILGMYSLRCVRCKENKYVYLYSWFIPVSQ